jgi:hypothetical protein
MNLRRLVLTDVQPLPMNEQADELLTALAIGQRIINSKQDYTKYFKIISMEVDNK